MTHIIKLAEFFEGELNSSLQSLIVTKDKLGSYLLFGKYKIVPTKQGYFKVIVADKNLVEEFSSLRNAAAWCTLHNAELYREYTRLQQLDLKLSSLSLDIAVHRQLIRTTKSIETKTLHIIRLQEDSHTKRQVVKEIKSFINSSRILQSKKFSGIKDRTFSYL